MSGAGYQAASLQTGFSPVQMAGVPTKQVALGFLSMVSRPGLSTLPLPSVPLVVLVALVPAFVGMSAGVDLVYFEVPGLLAVELIGSMFQLSFVDAAPAALST